MSVANVNPFDLLDEENEAPEQLAKARAATKPAAAAKPKTEEKGE
jgi:hypothetical protein